MKNITRDIIILGVAIIVIIALVAINVSATCTSHTPIRGYVVHHTDINGDCKDCGTSTVTHGGCKGAVRTTDSSCIETDHQNVKYHRACKSKVCVSTRVNALGLDLPEPVNVIDGSDTPCTE